MPEPTGRRGTATVASRLPVSDLQRGGGGSAMRVVLADDSVLFRAGLASLLSDAGFDVVGQAGDGAALLDLVAAVGPDVAIVDIRMPPNYIDEGLVAALRMRSEYPGVGVLVLSQYVETHHAMKLIGDGADGVGYLLKDRVANTAEFTDAVSRVGSGGSAIDGDVVSRLVSRHHVQDPLERLTAREHDVLALMAEGLTNRAIADQLYVGTRSRRVTYRQHLHQAGACPRRRSPTGAGDPGLPSAVAGVKHLGPGHERSLH